MLGSCTAALIAFWAALTPWRLDTDTQEQREARRIPVAVAICEATRGPVERAFLGWQVYAETKLAEPVLSWECWRMPKGERCDNLHAIGPWQTHLNEAQDCRDVWNPEIPDSVRLVAGARCVLRNWRYGVHRWHSWAGGFQGCGGIAGWVHPWAERRATRMGPLVVVMRGLESER